MTGLHVLHCRPYVVPLIVVYFSEYAIQAGAWAAIGFPIHDEAARKSFCKD